MESPLIGRYVMCMQKRCATYIYFSWISCRVLSYFVQGFKSPFFNESHTRYRKAVRKFMEEELMVRGQMIEESGSEVPLEMVRLLNTNSTCS